MHRVLEKIKEEFFAALPPTIFFFVMLHIVSVVRVLMANGTNFQPMSADRDVLHGARAGARCGSIA